jgi:hypothetical protein
MHLLSSSSKYPSIHLQAEGSLKTESQDEHFIPSKQVTHLGAQA